MKKKKKEEQEEEEEEQKQEEEEEIAVKICVVAAGWYGLYIPNNKQLWKAFCPSKRCFAFLLTGIVERLVWFGF